LLLGELRESFTWLSRRERRTPRGEVVALPAWNNSPSCEGILVGAQKWLATKACQVAPHLRAGPARLPRLINHSPPCNLPLPLPSCPPICVLPLRLCPRNNQTARFKEMAWFRKENKPPKTNPKAPASKIPADVWGKSVKGLRPILPDIRRKTFSKNPQTSLPEIAAYPPPHSRGSITSISSSDDGSIEEKDSDLRSVDPLNFPEYPRQPSRKAHTNAGDSRRDRHCHPGTNGEMPVNVGVMVDFAFMGGSMGSVVRRENRAARAALASSGKFPLNHRSPRRRRARMQEGRAPRFMCKMGQRRRPCSSRSWRSGAFRMSRFSRTPQTGGGVSASFAMLGDAILRRSRAQ